MKEVVIALIAVAVGFAIGAIIAHFVGGGGKKDTAELIKSERENLGFQSGDESEHFILPS